MHAAILSIHLLLALALILVVLLQRSEGGGLGVGGGGGGIMTSRGAATALSKVTWFVGLAFVATSLTLTIIAARDAGTGSLVDTLMPQAAGTADAPAVPGLGGGDLLPQLPAGETPAVPEAAVPDAPTAGAPATPAPADGPAAPPPVQ